MSPTFPDRLRELARHLTARRPLTARDRKLLYDAAQEIHRLEELVEQAEVDTHRQVTSRMRQQNERGAEL